MSTVRESPRAAPDFAAIKQRQQATVARRFAQVTSTDYAPSLLDKGRLRAKAEGLEVRFRVTDAEALPFADESFDITLSTFGAMFAPDHERTAREMLRVTRPNGRIGLASWTPDSFIGRVFKVVAAHVPPPAGVQSPVLWGTAEHLQALFGALASRLHCQRRVFNFRYASPAHWIQVFCDFYGPTHKALRRARRGRPAGLAARPDRAAGRDEHGRCGLARDPERVPRSRDHQAGGALRA